MCICNTRGGGGVGGGLRNVKQVCNLGGKREVLNRKREVLSRMREAI